MSSETEKRNCRVRDGAFVEPCDTLARSADVAGLGKGKGIACWSFVNMKTHKASKTFYGVRSRSFPEGMAFNFCPFCGENISAPFSAENAAA